MRHNLVTNLQWQFDNCWFLESLLNKLPRISSKQRKKKSYYTRKFPKLKIDRKIVSKVLQIYYIGLYHASSIETNIFHKINK